MTAFFPFLRAGALALAAALALSACSPTYNWREVRGQDAPFVVLLPGKPATHAREIDLNGLRVTMSMTATEVDGVTFAVGSVQVPEQAAVQPALSAMQTALLRNIDGTVRQEKSLPASVGTIAPVEIEARGTARNGQPILLFARFTARGTRVYQAIVVGNEKSVSPEAVDTFMTSFKVN
jgi:hypothetical protein